MRNELSVASPTPRSFFLPYPELVEPGPHDGAWIVADSNDHDWLPSNGATDKPHKRIFVPLEKGGEGVTQTHTAPTAMTDIVNTLQFPIEAVLVPVILRRPLDGMAGRCLQVSFSHNLPPQVETRFMIGESR